MHRALREQLASVSGASGAGSVIRDVGRESLMLRKLIIIAAGLALGGLCLIVFLRHHPVSAEDDHIRALASLRYPPTTTSLRGYFPSDYLQWNLQGRHSYSQVIQRKNQHQESLVALGYLQRRNFTLHGKLEDGMQLQQLQQLHRSACEAAGLGSPLVFWSTDWSNRVTVTARPSEVRVFEELLRRFDSTNTAPNPQGGANGRQPFSSDTNRTSAAAASRRSLNVMPCHERVRYLRRV